MPLTSSSVVGVLGAGAMGAGIAQVAAAAGHTVVLADAHQPALQRALDGFAKEMARDVEKGRRTQAEANALVARISLADAGAGMQPFANCELVIEAIVEDLAVKRAVFAALESAVAPTAVLATNTSSLSISAIAAACTRPDRILGVHFFNPAPRMPLVEIIAGVATDATVVTNARALVDAWGKTTVLATDTPGFIVNRVARPFYGEALRIAEEGIADPATIDWAMRELGKFRMGPFELMDFIGHDINYTVTKSVWEAMYFDERFKPSLLQKRLLDAGRLGRKSGRGFYEYADGAPKPSPSEDPKLGGEILNRIVVMLINEAADAVHLGVATAAEIDLAMTKGVNYPRGLLAWANDIGPAEVLARMDALHLEYRESRYRASPLLRWLVREGRTFGV